MTVAVLGNSTIALSGINLDEAQFKTDKKLQDAELTELLKVLCMCNCVVINGQSRLEEEKGG